MKRKGVIISIVLIIGVMILGGIFFAQKKYQDDNNKRQVITDSSSSQSVKVEKLPDARKSDWNLILVNKWHKTNELNPRLITIDGKQVNEKIVKETKQFLQAAKKVSKDEHLISGYRSVSYQAGLYNYYVEKEMNGNGTINKEGKKITKKKAISNTNTYSMPPEMSEHNTGLAIDMSTIDSLNESDPKIVKVIQDIAPEYGFVLRFKKDKTNSTGVGYEDWHYRFVGVNNAKYMTKNNLSLEEYLNLLPK